MRKQFEFSEEDLYLAAREAEQFIRAQYPDAQTCPPHTFSPAFEADMQQLFAQLQNGTLKTSAARLGWPYYLRRSIAAILLCFLLACATMPEAVMAGYQKLIEVVEHVFEEYTEFQYHSDVTNDAKFKPLKLVNVPYDMETVRYVEKENSVDFLYENKNGKYFNIFQKMMTEDDITVYGVDTNSAQIKNISIKSENIKLIIKENRIYFVWIHEKYRIMGQTNLSEEQIIDVLEQVEF